MLADVHACGYGAAIVSFDEHAGLLRVDGEEDRTTAGRRRPALSAALRAGRDVVVDLSGLQATDSSLLVDIAVLAQRLRKCGREVRLLSPQPHIQRLIEAVGLHRQPAVALVA